MQRILESIKELPQVLKSIGSKKLFLVIDASYPFLNIKDSIESLDIAEKVKFSDFTPNPLYEQVCEGLKLLKESHCDAILAIGGGSAIDVAKCIKLAALAKEDTMALIPPIVSQRVPIEHGKLPLIAIPTTAGTGSESTHNAVIYYEGAKQTVTNDEILPDFAILESSVLYTLPLHQKKCTMMDALCQGIESWWSVNSTDESRDYSKKTVELVMAHWRQYIFDNAPEATRQIMLAANYSGRAINIAQTTAAHAMSYKITSLFKFPHGHAVAVCLPEIWKYMLDHPEKCKDERGKSHVETVFNQIAKAMGTNSPHDAIKIFYAMMGAMDLGHPTADCDRRSILETLSRSVNPIRLKNNPVELDEDTILALYQEIVPVLSKRP